MRFGFIYLFLLAFVFYYVSFLFPYCIFSDFSRVIVFFSFFCFLFFHLKLFRFLSALLYHVASFLLVVGV